MRVKDQAQSLLSVDKGCLVTTIKCDDSNGRCMLTLVRKTFCDIWILIDSLKDTDAAGKYKIKSYPNFEKRNDDKWYKIQINQPLDHMLSSDSVQPHKLIWSIEEHTADENSKGVEDVIRVDRSVTEQSPIAIQWKIKLRE
eukprot:GHVN01091593.1.p1 GENE.GHVN01091593.1~~GHVN01091593.1.p1  ORF type:complete len:141 (+),score=11.72 GHVN01091593.1:518-940(+)